MTRRTQITHRWAMRGVDNKVQPTNTLCGIKAASANVTRNRRKVTCPDCKRLQRALGS